VSLYSSILDLRSNVSYEVTFVWGYCHAYLISLLEMKALYISSAPIWRWQLFVHISLIVYQSSHNSVR
jgi:hypothetical protein